MNQRSLRIPHPRQEIGPMACEPLKVPTALTDDDTSCAVDRLKCYFGLPPHGLPYTGASFERLGGGGDRPDAANELTAEDIVAVSMLSVRIPGGAVLELLEKHRPAISDLLKQIPTDRDLVTVDPVAIDGTWVASELWRLLKTVRGCGWVTVSKLLARKRPRLIPVYDKIVAAQVGWPTSYWRSLACALRADDAALHRHLLRLRDEAGLPPSISAIRVFDVVTWMLGKYGPTECGSARENHPCTTCVRSA